MVAVIVNGNHKGEKIDLKNTVEKSQIDYLDLKVKDEVYVSIKEDSNKKIISTKLIGYKRDKYIVEIIIVFAVLILLIGKIKGFKSLASLVINIVIFSVLIKLFLYNYNLIFISIIASILFIVLSILIVNGTNKKAITAIIGTMLGTLITMLIATIVMFSNNWNGVYFDSMEFLPNGKIFLVEILIGTLGAIMDIAISISSALNELYVTNHNISIKSLVSSGISIGKDIMGTMSNTLLFAYISGSIPLIILLLENNIPISYIVNVNLSLEIVRALTGSIGIVLSIPITIFASVILLKNTKAKEGIKS
jgi:uncharacterized membrane protein